MTGNSDKLRSLFLATLMVLSVVAMTTTFAGTAVAANNSTVDSRTQTPNTDPVTVYLGEEGLNIDLDTSESNNVNTGDVTLVGQAGDADGTTASVDMDDADITSANGFTTGAYTVGGEDNDGEIDISVREPQVTDVEVFRGGDTSGAEVTGGSIPSGDTFTVTADFNFGQAAAAEIEITDETGTDITGTALASGENESLVSADDAVTFNTGDLDAEDYTITVSGDDDYDATETDFSGASSSTTLTIRDDDVTVSLNSEEVVSGAIVTGTITGTPGSNVTVRVEKNDLNESIGTSGSPNYQDIVTGSTADNLFRVTSDLIDEAEQNAPNSATGSIGGMYELGDSGSAKFQIRSRVLEEDSTATIEVVEEQDSGSATLDGLIEAEDFSANEDDDVDVRINEPAITVDSAPSVLVIGEDFDIEGTAPEIDRVTPYARLDDTYYRIGDDSSHSVDSDDTFELEDLNSSDNSALSIPGNYRVSIADWSEAQAVDAGGEIDDDDWSDIDAKTSISLRTQVGQLSAQLNSNTVAYGSSVNDEVELSGTSLGSGGNVEYIVIGPRGTTMSSGVSVEDDNNFSEDIDGFDNRGTYSIVVIGQGRDGNWGPGVSPTAYESGTLSNGNTREQNLELIRDDFEDAGVDDQLVFLSLQAENPQLTIDPLSQSGTVTPGEVTVSGTSNREDETEIFVEVLDSDNNAVASANAEVDGPTSSWETTIDMNGLSPGQYTIRAQDSESTAERDIQLAESTPTPTPDEETPTPEDDTPTEEPDTPTEEPDTEEPDTETSAPDTMAPDTDTDTPTPTTGPGFGVIVGILALLGAGLLATRRRD